MIEQYRQSKDKLSKEIFLPPEAATIHAEIVTKLKGMIDGDQALQAAIARDDQELEARRERWAEYSKRKWGGQTRIALPEFLRVHGIVERNATHQKKVWERQWEESVRWASDFERQFLATAAAIGQGRFVEVLQISLVSDGQVTNSDAAVGSGMEVTQESIDSVIKNLDIVSSVPEIVYIVHNHFDEYFELAIPQDEEPKDGFAIVGGLSKRDIEFADKLWSETLEKKTRVVMVAINERGLTFSYEAGTSKHRDWENDPQ